MAGETKTTIVGNLTSDPEMKFTPDGTGVANFTVASTTRNYDKSTQQWKDGNTLYVRCSAWRAEAENVANTLKKGMRVIVLGDLVMRQYETKDGSKGTSVELTNVEVGPSLRLSSFTQNPRNDNQNNNNGGNNGGSNNPWGNNPNTNWGNNSGSNDAPF